MPTYDLVLLVKKLPVSELKSTLKRTALSIFKTGAVLRNIDNLGFRKLPYRITEHRESYKEAHVFVYTFDGAMSKFSPLVDSLRRDMDVIRQRIFFIEDKLKIKEKKHECDIYLDLLEVPDRPHVKLMVDLSKKKERKPFFYGGGRDYDPTAK